MSIQELRLEDIEADWPRLGLLLADSVSEARKDRLRQLLSSEGTYALVAETGGAPTGLAVVEHFQSAWIFDDHVASIREFAVPEAPARGELLAAIDRRARDAGMSHLSRFLPVDEALLSWWQGAGFSEYMTAFRRPIDDEATLVSSSEAGIPRTRGADDGVAISAMTDVEADWPKLWPLLDQLDAHHAALTGSPLHDHREQDIRRNLQQEIDDGEALVMLAEVAGRAVATSAAELGERHGDGTRTGYRSRLFVEEPYRGRGLSTGFEALALPWLRERGVTDVERWIVAGNENPRQIWAARGYQPERILLRKALRP